MPFLPEVEELVKEFGLTPEERAQVESILGKPERQEKLKGGVLRQSEFTKKMQALDKQRADAEAALAEKERKVAEDAASLGTWKQSADDVILKNQQAAEAARVKLATMTEKIRTLAERQGVDPKEWLGEETPPPPPPEKKEAVDTSEFDKRYLARGDADKLLAEVKSSPFIAAEIEDIVDEHRALFGKGLNRKELVTSALKNKRSLREEWETAHEVSKRRAELNERTIEERINARVAEERTKILSEHKLPVNRGDDGGSPILRMGDQLKLDGTDRSRVTQGVSAVDAAIAAHNTGKYRSAPPAPTEKTT